MMRSVINILLAIPRLQYGIRMLTADVTQMFAPGLADSKSARMERADHISQYTEMNGDRAYAPISAK